MLQMIYAIAPIFILIVLGNLLRRNDIPSLEFWNLNDRLVYWVLFPSLLFFKMATLDIPTERIGNLAIVIYAGFAAAALFALLAAPLGGISRPTWTSVLQGSARHNTFIALAVAERVFGVEGLALAALVTALLIPITNVTVVTLMVLALKGGGESGVIRAIARDLVRNPILIAVALGAGFNLAGWRDVPVVLDATSILGSAALPIVLLCVGANIHVRAAMAAWAPVALSIVGKLVVFPLAVGWTSVALGLDLLTAQILMVFAAVPTSAGAYTLARQMGGDAPAMAAIVAIQTGVSFVTLPLTLMLVQARVFT